MNMLTGYKTHLTAASAIIGALVAYANGQVELVATVQVVVGSLLATFLRVGIASEIDKLSR